MNKMFSSKLILFFSCVAIAVAIGGVFLLNQRSEPQTTSNPNPTPAEGIHKDWVMYRNEKLGIEFEYPRSFQEDSGCNIWKYADDRPEINFALWGVKVIDVGNKEFGLFLQDFIQEKKDERYITSIIDERRLRIDGHSAIIIDHLTDRKFAGSGSPDHRGKFAVIENKDKAIFASYINGVTRCVAPAPPEDPFDHLISTLHFIK